VSDLGPALTVWTDSLLSLKAASEAQKAGRWEEFRTELGQYMAEQKSAKKAFADVTAPPTLSALHEGVVRGIGQSISGMNRFRKAFKAYGSAPTVSSRDETKLMGLWNAACDDGIESALAMRLWAVALATDMDDAGVPEPQWLRDGVSRLKEAL